MSNRLFQEAKKAVMLAKEAANEQANHTNEAIAIAKNALSSAYAHSNVAEKAQLRQLQEELDHLK
ncbi:hypothetical protein GGR02_002136 [Anoxybacillus voinovskiensis]|uniref:DUF3813 domain-containing protein n=1 Tax=Anoxybacteroides voinovskiense TaxID=230470 RepID=A0A840DN41_9BACL|nr:DUF3813 domain-containing protein [Anoxybacillus voinovskiensis]MBB4074370.1 hypothetical protein [Anoxybacillus voinovskiensis]GGJ70403.1 hypothetical protein GCM10008982_19690 [Anoxybacillus voinovskiensis]